ncbi:hypothetical protein DPMN_055327 [Dreissena polymorpha]|uniref:Uncharacterized protein n=1 Tax=Dreissena polymorpha TaxID=45954 RepID=A0A9D4CRF3_DREPO|nr:hypothetical protein DPMN_055327 [Dreissena polymorpha]
MQSFHPLPIRLWGAKQGAEVPFVFGFVDELKVFAGVHPSVPNSLKNIGRRKQPRTG